MTKSTRVLIVASILVTVSVSAVSAAFFAGEKPPGAINLLPDYTHERKQGFDSIPGVISKKGGLEIVYDIGSIPKPGAPRFGGQFSDRAKAVPAAQRLWYKEQIVNGQPVHLAWTKQKRLLASYPKSGINFSVNVKTFEELADALLIILSYPEAPKAPAKGK
jgi:hypothetical protein